MAEILNDVALPKTRIKLINEETQEETPVDVLTSADAVSTNDGKNAQEKMDAYDAHINNLAIHSDAFVKVMQVVTIPTTGWVAITPEDDEYPYMIEIEAEGVLESHNANVTIDLLSVPVAAACGLCPTMQTLTNKLKFWAREIPTAEIAAHMTLFGEGGVSGGDTGDSSGGGSSGGGSGSSGYVLPVATADTLGGVKIGDNIDIDAEGRITPTGATLSEEQTATDTDIDAVVADVFGSAGE